jgi:Domain of unknown function (DUF2382)
LEQFVISDRSVDSQQQPLRSTIVDPTNVLTSEVFQLLEERLMVDLTRRKTGEIVVRKEVDTQTLYVEVPVRREKLIVEQVSPEYKLLAQIDLGREYAGNGTTEFINNDDAGNGTTEFINNDDAGNGTTEFINNDDAILVSSESKSFPLDRAPNARDIVSSQVDSPQAAIDLLTALAQIDSDDVQTIRIEIALKDNCNRDRYQKLVAGDL